MANDVLSFLKNFTEEGEADEFRTADVIEKAEAISTGSIALDMALGCGGYPKGRITQVYGPPGCHIKGQLILMADGSTKKVEDVVIGDRLMGDSSEIRTVLELKRGFGKMFEVCPVRGKSFIVNEDHILTLVRNNWMMTRQLRRNRISVSGKRRNRHSKIRYLQNNSHFEIIDISVKDFLKLSKEKRKYHSLIKTSVNHFENEQNDLPIDPYVLGLLIGDGSLSHGICLTTADEEIFSSFKEFVNKNNLEIKECYKSNKNNKSTTWRAKRIVGSGEPNRNHIFEIIKSLNLNVKCDFKHVPQCYKTSSVENRLKMLAGLLDTDGYYNDRNCFDFISKSKQLSEDVVFLSRSVGLTASVNACKKSAYLGHTDTYYRVYIGGDCSIIPTQVNRKKTKKNNKSKINVLHTSFEIKKTDDNYFYGFELDGNGRYLLDDFTITHNSGKTMFCLIAIKIAQILDPTAKQVWIDAEQTFNQKWAKQLGVDPSRIVIIDGEKAQIGRQCFEILIGVPREDSKTHAYAGKKQNGLFDEIAIGNLNINLVVLDSLGAIVPPIEDVSQVGKAGIAPLPRFLGKELKRVSLDVRKANVPFIIINHVKATMDMYSSSDHTFSGGNSYVHFLSANIFLKPMTKKETKILDEKENKIGHTLQATVEKTKFGPWPRTVEFKVEFTKGIVDTYEELATTAVEYGVISRSGNTYEFGGEKWVGAGKLADAIKESPDLQNALENCLRAKLGEDSVSATKIEESVEEDGEKKVKRGRKAKNEE